jgi:hypothetical protein
MTALDNLLDGLFDYAGLFPPAALDVESAVGNYRTYQQSENAPSLGRFVVDLGRVPAVKAAAEDAFGRMPLSVTARAVSDWSVLSSLIERGARIETVEVSGAGPQEIGEVARALAPGFEVYFEIPFDPSAERRLDAICAAGARVKLRMGGAAAEAFPTSQAVAGTLQSIADRHLSFKATAGLHHPLPSLPPFRDAPDAAHGPMHGFVNLACAATLIHLGGGVEDATRLLEETDPRVWSAGGSAIACRELRWTAAQMREARQEFFGSIGSCSFTEPMADLEALGWR